MRKDKSLILANYKERFIWLDGEITPIIADKFRKMLVCMNKIEHEPIYFYIRGMGGSFEHTRKMMRMMKESSNPIATIVHGYVSSGSFILSQGGNKRMAMPHTKLLFHNAALGLEKRMINAGQIEQKDLLRHTHWILIVDGMQLSYFLRKNRPDKDSEIRDLFLEGAIISVTKARKLGLIDTFYDEVDFNKDYKIVKRMIRKTR